MNLKIFSIDKRIWNIYMFFLVLPAFHWWAWEWMLISRQVKHQCIRALAPLHQEKLVIHKCGPCILRGSSQRTKSIEQYHYSWLILTNSPKWKCTEFLTWGEFLKLLSKPEPNNSSRRFQSCSRNAGRRKPSCINFITLKEKFRFSYQRSFKM